MSTTYTFTVEVETDTLEHAQQVISERVCFDEELLDDNGEDIEYTIGTDSIPLFIRED